MIASTHLAVGAATGIMVQGCLSSDASNLEKLFWSFTAGFVSHLILDSFPHQEYSLGNAKLGAVLFVEIMAILFLLLSPSNSWLVNSIIFFGMAGGAVPDLVNLTSQYIVRLSWLVNLGSAIHVFHGAVPTDFEIGFYVQSLITIIAVALVKLRSA